MEKRILAGIQLKTDLFKGVFDDDGPDEVAFSREKREEMLNRLRAMMGETPEPEGFVTSDPEEIPEDTPCYLNPEVLDRAEDTVEETAAQGPAGVFDGQSPEKMETVLNSGMAFIGGLMEMATGRKIERSTGQETGQEKMIQIDKETGEVTMKFKLPGFSTHHRQGGNPLATAAIRRLGLWQEWFEAVE